jgi:hypothetical protein
LQLARSTVSSARYAYVRNGWKPDVHMLAVST